MLKDYLKTHLKTEKPIEVTSELLVELFTDYKMIRHRVYNGHSSRSTNRKVKSLKELIKIIDSMGPEPVLEWVQRADGFVWRIESPKTSWDQHILLW